MKRRALFIATARLASVCCVLLGALLLFSGQAAADGFASFYPTDGYSEQAILMVSWDAGPGAGASASGDWAADYAPAGAENAARTPVTVELSGLTVFNSWDAAVQDAPAEATYVSPAAHAADPAPSFGGANSEISRHNGVSPETPSFDTLHSLAMNGTQWSDAFQAGASDYVSPGQYYLLLDKSRYLLSVYATDGLGNRSDVPLRSVVVAIGKRTTPTPVGVFSLGEKEQWHYFGPSYSPFAIRYASGKYLHGPLYHARNEGSLNTARLADFGTMATGGCIRMPYEDARWIYENCPPGTKLEIING
ncbi:L,D-transpeptidase [Eubacteriales bacterium OttesenSCG-928-A19]|nr:L,D-transpeptidase [Eubacteriales bacterium OttesenSCG-928-A19]